MTYRPLSPVAISRLTELCAPERVITDPAALADYGHDESVETPHLPEALVRAASTEEVSAVLRLASEEHVPVTPRGLGTGLSGGAVPLRGGIVLSLELMKDTAVDTGNLMVETGPGSTTARVQQTCADSGLYYPVDPASLDDCSIGGNVAENAGGARAFKYGVTGDYLRGVEAVLASGEIIRYGGKLHKNVVGYDLNRLLIGSEGTLAVITGITLRLIPKPRYLVDLLIPFERMSQGLELVARLVHDQRLMPAVVEFIEHKGVCAANQVMKDALPFPDARVQVLVELDGNDRQRVMDDCVAVGELAMRLGAREPLVADNPTDQDRLWHARRELHNILKEVYAGLATEDIVVPLSEINTTIEKLELLEQKHGVPIVPWGHIGDGNIHVGMCREDKTGSRQQWLERKRAIVSDLADFVLSRGGQISAEHGIGSTKKWLMKRAVGPQELALMQSLKHALDPEGILNPGKILPDEQ
ncbi:MAG TPA: FAD-binding oxidoreductase [bacterium]|nr:FAD-binding oxidoreductase [bacterium]